MRSAISRFIFNPLAITIAALCSLLAVESQPVRVVEFQGGLRVMVEATLGGLPTKVPVQLTGIVLIGPQEYATQKIKELCPVGSFVMLQVPGAQLEPDAFGVIKAWILRDFPGPVDPAAPIIPAPITPAPITNTPPVAKEGMVRSSIQVELMRAGWALPEEQQPSRDVPPQMVAQIRTALEEARTRRMGAYSLPGFVPPTPTPNGRPSPIPPQLRPPLSPPQPGSRPAPSEPLPNTPPPAVPPPPVDPAAANGF